MTPAHKQAVEALRETRDALDAIKSMVVGEAGPRWGHDFATTTTRLRIADTADAVLAHADLVLARNARETRA